MIDWLAATTGLSPKEMIFSILIGVLIGILATK